MLKFLKSLWFKSPQIVENTQKESAVKIQASKAKIGSLIQIQERDYVSIYAEGSRHSPWWLLRINELDATVVSKMKPAKKSDRWLLKVKTKDGQLFNAWYYENQKVRVVSQ